MKKRHERDLRELIAMRTVSASPSSGPALQLAAEWLAERIESRGTASILDLDGTVVVDGTIPSSLGGNVPTVLAYGHFDVLPPGDESAWNSSPFELTKAGEWLVGRGIADDKGQLYMLLEAATSLASEGALPVHVRFLLDSAEEIGGPEVPRFLMSGAAPADVCVIFDSGPIERGTPVIRVATRGLVYLRLTVTTSSMPLHSGLYGGVALNAAHALLQALSTIVPPAGGAPQELHRGLRLPEKSELGQPLHTAYGRRLLAADGVVTIEGVEPSEVTQRTWFQPALDLHALHSGNTSELATTIPETAQATFSIRLSPDQSPAEITTQLTEMVQDAAPHGTKVDLEVLASTSPAATAVDGAAVKLAIDSFRTVFGRPPEIARLAGSLPVFGALAERQVPTILTGFALPESNIHGLNERLLAEDIGRGIELARQLLTDFGSLPVRKA